MLVYQLHNIIVVKHAFFQYKQIAPRGEVAMFGVPGYFCYLVICKVNFFTRSLKKFIRQRCESPDPKPKSHMVNPVLVTAEFDFQCKTKISFAQNIGNKNCAFRRCDNVEASIK